MSTKLASDLDNTDFAGAVNPDSRLAVRFHMVSVQNNFETERQKRPIFEDIPYIEIFVPGDSTLTVDTPVREEHKKRFPMHWAHFQNTHGEDTREIGTPLAQWPRLKPSQVEELRALKFFTVESIAGVSDANLQRLPAITGVSGHTLREAAKRFLEIAHNDAAVAQYEERAKAIEAKAAEEKAEMQKKLDDLQAQIAALAPKPKRKYTKRVATE